MAGGRRPVIGGRWLVAGITQERDLHHRPPATDLRPRTTGHGPPATGHRPPTTGHRSPRPPTPSLLLSSHFVFDLDYSEI